MHSARNRKRHVDMNRHEMEAPDDLNVSASAKKLKQRDFYDIEVDSNFGYRFLNCVAVFAVISNVVVCKVCHSGVKFTETSKRGLGFRIVIVKNIANATDVCKNSILNAAEEEKIIYAEKGDKNGITVSGDGSWQKRGFSSLYDLVSLIGWNTGKIIDVIVKSKYC